MKNVSILKLANVIGATVLQTAGDKMPAAGDVFTGVSTDSRTVRSGDCFFAIEGEKFNGHHFVEDAFSKGAVCAVVARDIRCDGYAGRTVLKVEDTVKAMGDFAGHYRRGADFKVVAITGSVGKTTTRQIVWHVLSRRFRVLQSPKNFNNHIGLPLSLLAAEPDTEIVVVELGTNHPGEIGYLTRIAEPDVALVTTVEPAHLEGFGDLDAIAEEKLAIAEGLRPRGTLLLNGDYPQLLRLALAQGRRFRSFGTSPGCDYRARDVKSYGLTSTFKVDASEVDVPLPGLGNATNALAAWAVCAQFGVGLSYFTAAIKTVSAPAMRMEVVQLGALTVINDCYNANPASMKNAIDVLDVLGRTHEAREVFVCGDMGELGVHAEHLHTELGLRISESNVAILLAAGKLAGLAAAAARTGRANLETHCFSDAAAIADALHKFVRNTDIILVKGSRLNNLELVVKKLKELFSPETGRDMEYGKRDG